MKKVLIILPNSIGGTLVMKGFKQGFKSNGCFVLEKDLRELTIENIKQFNPDIIFGYDYGFLFGDDKELSEYIIANKDRYKLIHYFADEPQNKFAFVNKPYLYEKFKTIGAISYIWDKDFVQDLPFCSYLPLAVNYKAYRPQESSHYDISLVLRPVTEKRQKIVSALIKTFGSKVNIFCYEKHFLQGLDDIKNKHLLNEKELDIYKNAYKGFPKTEQDLANIYFNSTVNINITQQGTSGMNYRVFEVLASRGFLLTDAMEDIERNFVISKELEVYNNIDDLLDKTSFYLKHPQIAQKIAIIGYTDVIKSHSYTARARKILEDLK